MNQGEWGETSYLASLFSRFWSFLSLALEWVAVVLAGLIPAPVLTFRRNASSAVVQSRQHAGGCTHLVGSIFQTLLPARPLSDFSSRQCTVSALPVHVVIAVPKRAVVCASQVRSVPDARALLLLFLGVCMPVISLGWSCLTGTLQSHY